MTPNDLRNAKSPDNLAPLQAALWHEARGNWEKSHELAQSDETRAGAHVHAYLHRKEGDETNARHWYERAGQPFPTETLEAEWAKIAQAIPNRR